MKKLTENFISALKKLPHWQALVGYAEQQPEDMSNLQNEANIKSGTVENKPTESAVVLDIETPPPPTVKEKGDEKKT